MKTSRGTQSADLYILGGGVDLIRDLTPATESAIRKARVLFDLTGHGETFKRLCPKVVDLTEVYWHSGEYSTAYRSIKRRIVREVRSGPGVAVIDHGHPVLFDGVSQDLLDYCRRTGKRAESIPAVSFLDALSCLLNNDFGLGLQVFDATAFVDGDVSVDPRAALILVQVGNLNTKGPANCRQSLSGSILPLKERLLSVYSGRTRIALAFAGDHDFKSIVRWETIERLGRLRARIFSGVSLFVPPVRSQQDPPMSRAR